MKLKLFRIILLVTLCFLVSVFRVYADPLPINPTPPLAAAFSLSAELDLGEPVFAKNAITKKGEMSSFHFLPKKTDIVSRADPKSGRTYQTPVTTVYQNQTSWCWAASIEMVLQYHKVTETQEEIVTRTYGLDEYGDPRITGADIIHISFAVNQWHKDKNEKLYRIMGTFSPGYPAEKLLIREIVQRKKPAIITYEIPTLIDNKPEVIRHAVVISGLESENNKISKIVLRDPWKSPENISLNGRVEKDRDFLKYVTGVWYIDVDAVEL